MFRTIIILTIIGCTSAGKFETIHEWHYMDYLYECDWQRDQIIAENKYNRSRLFPMDVYRVKDGRIFVTTPAQYANATPATLSTVSNCTGPGGPLLKPYPNWQWHNSTNCTGITSVWQITVDDFNRIWILDTGKIAMEPVCPPQYLIFDLNTDKFLRRIMIPNDVSQAPGNLTSGWLSHPIIESTDINFKGTWVFASHVGPGGMIIYNGSKFWRLDDDVFHPARLTANYTIDGSSWNNPPNGLIGLTLTPPTSSLGRRLFLKGLASLQLNSVSSDDIRKTANKKFDICATTSKHRFSSPLTAQAISKKTGIMFFALSQEIAVGCWNTNSPLDADHMDIVAQNNETLQFISSIRVIECLNNPAEEEVLITSNRLNKVVTFTINFEDINFRILNASASKLIAGCKCQSPDDEPPNLIDALMDIIFGR